MMVWLARRIVISLLIPYLWRWWRGRGSSVPQCSAPADGTMAACRSTLTRGTASRWRRTSSGRR